MRCQRIVRRWLATPRHDKTRTLLGGAGRLVARLVCGALAQDEEKGLGAARLCEQLLDDRLLHVAISTLAQLRQEGEQRWVLRGGVLLVA